MIRKCCNCIGQKLKKHRNIHYFVGEYKNKIVSSCFLIIIPQLTRAGLPYGFIENVITHKLFRRKGFATDVLEYSLKFAWEENCYQVMLMTGNKKEEATKLYTKVGFKRGIKRGFITYKN